MCMMETTQCPYCEALIEYDSSELEPGMEIIEIACVDCIEGFEEELDYPDFFIIFDDDLDIGEREMIF